MEQDLYNDRDPGKKVGDPVFQSPLFGDLATGVGTRIIFFWSQYLCSIATGWNIIPTPALDVGRCLSLLNTLMIKVILLIAVDQ